LNRQVEKRSKVGWKYDRLNCRVRRLVQNSAGTATAKQRCFFDTNVTDPSFDEVVIVINETLTEKTKVKKGLALVYQIVLHDSFLAERFWIRQRHFIYGRGSYGKLTARKSLN
jgi:hypothetical protein